STAGISNFDFMRGTRFGGAFTTASTVNSAAISLAGEITTLTKGAVAIIGPSIANTGTISVNQGMVILAAVDAATVDYTPRFSLENGLALLTIAPNSNLAHGFAITNSGTITSYGGQIALQAAVANSGQSSSITNSGTITATTFAPGWQFSPLTMRGTISISAEAGSVLLTSSSVITANGPVAAGIIHIGGEFGGANLNLPNSHSVVMQEGAKISASGEGRYGRGGDISIWGTGSVAIGGTITARGGQEVIASATDIARYRNLNLNDGGLVEVSSLGDYELTAVVDTSAREGYGTTGTLIIDPANVELVTSCVLDRGDTCAANSGTYKSLMNIPGGPGTYQILVSRLIAKLASTSIIIVAPDDNTIANTGKITVSGPINYTGTNSLTLRGGREGIIVNANITTNGSLTLETLTGGITIGGALSSGGDLTLRAGNNGISIKANLSSTGLQTLETLTGKITIGEAIVAGTNQAIGGALSSGGDLTLNAPKGAVEINRSITMTRALVGVDYANIAITAGKGIRLNSTINAPNANLVLTNNKVIDTDVTYNGIKNNGSLITVHRFEMFDYYQLGVNDTFTNMNVEILGSVVLGSRRANQTSHFVFSNNRSLQIDGGSFILGTADISTAAGYDITMVKTGIPNQFNVKAGGSESSINGYKLLSIAAANGAPAASEVGLYIHSGRNFYNYTDPNGNSNQGKVALSSDSGIYLSAAGTITTSGYRINSDKSETSLAPIFAVGSVTVFAQGDITLGNEIGSQAGITIQSNGKINLQSSKIETESTSRINPYSLKSRQSSVLVTLESELIFLSSEMLKERALDGIEPLRDANSVFYTNNLVIRGVGIRVQSTTVKASNNVDIVAVGVTPVVTPTPTP
ncbi:MAG: hypothetical protein ORO03_02415, partial [Alphaproteobacteria bacterium]|nr:hypothetical protein [Alphaproteobacteria bacterium]